MSADSDTAQTFNALRKYRQDRRKLLGVRCVACIKREPKRSPTVLLPGQRCYCGYVDPRKRADA
ncbi:hypothetical protein UFOVP833_35 [uncultured Caudovirales phage]|uniref:Uncharacterized protein n=1 Tax=uncultured Caudovirales phage TaxID=2100421 RepID=A0A6J5SVF8_9CAUD|nr:hypothetical protein UFOVP833_35 [uncultured Caudovirales phage]CAB4218764.1 hypothetical protein UFOVP1603_52 [uncultured Caudovirales phage]